MAKKKLLLSVVCLAMVALIAVFGTVAYLTDRDSETNVFTSGDVSIDLQETFTQNSQLLPGVKLTKEVSILNDGKNDAWVWYTYAVPVEADKVLDIAVSENAGWITSPDIPNVEGVEVEIDGETVICNVYTRLYDSALLAGQTTSIDLSSVKLASNVDVVNGQYSTVDAGVVTAIDYDGSTKIEVCAYAIQKENFKTVEEAYNAYGIQWGLIAEPWDGTADTSWYNDTDSEFVITTPAQLAGFAKLVDDGNTFEGKTVKLGKDIDLYCLPEGATELKSFDPIGDDSPFAGTFDGQGFAVENLYQSGWAFGYEWGSYGSIGLFGELENATVKNLTIRGAESFVEGGDVGGICGSATGTCVFEDITLDRMQFWNFPTNCKFHTKIKQKRKVYHD